MLVRVRVVDGRARTQGKSKNQFRRGTDMKALGTRVRIGLGLIAMFCGGGVVAAQTSNDAAPVTASGSNGAVVPQLVKDSGVLTDAQGNALRGGVGGTLSLYEERTA